MAIKEQHYDEYISRRLPDGRPIFRGAVAPEMHSYILTLSSMGYSETEIEYTLRLMKEGKI